MVSFVNKRFELIDTFRGIAILWIVFYHFSADWRQHGGIFDALARYGLGVTVFFVISGFGVASSLGKALRAHETWYKYLLRRLDRIYVTYWCSILFSALIIPSLVALASAFKTHSFKPELPAYSFWEWTQTITLLKVFTAPSWTLALPFLPLNGAVWYLAVIVQIYLVVALSLCFGNKYPVVLLGVFMTSLLSLIPEIKATLPYGVFLPFFPQFYLGIIVNSLIAKGTIFNPHSKTHVVAALSLFAVIFSFIYIYPAPLPYACLIAFLFWLFYRYDEKFFRNPISRVFFTVGLFSYSLYLLHIPLWSLIDMSLRAFFPPSAYVISEFLQMLCVVFLSSLWYLFFEKPTTIAGILARIRRPVSTLTEYKTLLRSLMS